jgi:hypothetical protein
LKLTRFDEDFLPQSALKRQGMKDFSLKSFRKRNKSSTHLVLGPKRRSVIVLYASIWFGTIKKTVWVLLCSFITLSGFAQTASRDVVLLLDTSASMSNYYLEVRDYLSGPFLREFLRLGDTFHLISFSDQIRLEISRRVDGQSDIETIVGRLLLMYPLAPYSDIVSALRFAERYIISLPGSRPKSLVFISDGDNSPAPGTLLESINIQNLIADTAARLNRSAIDFDFIPIPRGSRPRLSSPSASPPAGAVQQAPSSRPSASPPAGAVQQAPSSRLSASPSGAVQQAPSPQPSAFPPAGAVQQAPSPQPSASPPAGAVQQAPSPQPSASPPAGAVQQAPPPRRADSPPDTGSRTIKQPRIQVPAMSIPADALFFGVIGTGGILLLAAAAFAVLALTRLCNAPNRMMGRVAEQALLSLNAADAMPPMLSLFVKDQPATNGRQNLHILEPGYSLSLGGDASDDFVISIVTVPRRIACVHFDGQRYTLIPQKHRSLPGLGSAPLQDCIGKEIRVVHNNFEVHLSIEQRENPLRNLGGFLRSFNSL